ncbi:hypothetical protein MKX03_000737 [Papaver bracteatum]|nr:hypothetical protein MKX03_000737 [Papaver bracteatum]
MDKQLQNKLNANRVVVGTLRGFDQFMNLVVDNTVEMNENDKNDIGMVRTITALNKILRNNLISLSGMIESVILSVIDC